MKSRTMQQTGTRDAFGNAGNETGRCLCLRCPVCGRSNSSLILRQGVVCEPVCPTCGFTFVQSGGIWKALTPMREERFEQFMIEYEMVRHREGRGSAGSHYYLGLPYKDLTGHNVWQWRIRYRSFRFFQQRILPWLEYRNPHGLDILDIGAGNCWMSYRLALRGHRPVAVDLLVNNLDGLGAAHHYFNYLPRSFELFQAEMDGLPFDGAQFDAAIFNASFHYSENYTRTLQGVSRCLRRPGHILIVDSPFYRNEESAQRMLQEKHLKFQSEYGFKSDSIPSREYLTPGALEEMSRECGIEWKLLEPWYGMGWALRPLKARLLRRRDPAKFYILWAMLGES